ncbi:hypothetical protein EYF80_024809 [Liparis tanakae]|uniref:Uncharacterized protein n=1 Tax=Liparis tanakae TaxID=230148 RepID=A0A4Z2HI24_9TELE|nr:hypothetical protein EYF80_024809 [Liparis tanakae]
MTANMNMKSWYTMRMLKTFFRDVTTQSKTACGGEREGGATCRTSVTGRPALHAVTHVRAKAIRAPTTTMKSRMFHMSRK